MLLRLSLTIALLMASCTRQQIAAPQIGATTPSPMASPQPSPSPTPMSAIHKIDFENFTYPAAPVYSRSGKPFTLKNGKFIGPLRDGAAEPYPVSLVDTIFGDVTADDVDDAIVVLTESVRGTLIPYYVYIFGIERDKPKFLWSFDTGDRAQGGLRRAFAENGDLVVELYGDKAYVGMPNYDASADCAACATHYTRSRYAWQNNHFRRVGNLEVFDHEGSAGYLDKSQR